MSGGGVFTLLTNDGKCDKLIMATDFLNRRIQHIMCARKAAGESDIMPTLKDVEKTHLLFVNAHFKPFCAMGHEYQKVRPNTGSPALGNTVTFAIPQFGDFFADMVMRVTMGVVSSSAQAIPTTAAGDFPVTNVIGTSTPLDWDGTALAGAATTTNSVAVAAYSLVDAFGANITGTSYYRNLVRYVEFPGERLCQEVKFDVNGNSLDLYEDVATVMMRKFTLSADKTVGYKRLCGQEVEMNGFSGSQQGRVIDNNSTSLNSLTSQTATASAVSAKLSNVTAVAANTNAAYLQAAFPDESWNYAVSSSAAALGGVTQSATVGYQSVYRESHKAVDGLQTPKLQQPATDLWCKFRFWFNERIDQAVPSVAIPSGQRFISVKLATQSQLVVEEPMIYIKRVLSSGAASGDSDSTISSRTVEYRPFVRAGTVSEVQLSNVELYVNNLFVNPEIHDIYISRIGFSLIRVFRMHKQTVSTPDNDDRQLSQLKWPIEYMFVGLRPVWNSAATNTTMHRDWHRMCKVVEVENQEWSSTSSVAVDAANAGVIAQAYRERRLLPIRYTKELKTFDTLSLTAHGVKIFDTFSEKFFSAYVPYAFGGPNIVTPQDEGCLMFNFALYPGVYQPSGHINVVIARAINFLLIANGSACLRFTT